MGFMVKVKKCPPKPLSHRPLDCFRSIISLKSFSNNPRRRCLILKLLFYFKRDFYQGMFIYFNANESFKMLYPIDLCYVYIFPGSLSRLKKNLPELCITHLSLYEDQHFYSGSRLFYFIIFVFHVSFLSFMTF